MTSDPTRALFDAVLRPHRSLGPRGFLMVMGILCTVSFIAGVSFLLLGAWPVLGFFGLDVAIVYLAFRANYAAARLEERLHLTENELTVARVWPSGARRQWRFQPYWLRVELDEPVTDKSQIRLRSHGKSLVVGSFLTPAERREVADALKRALAPLKQG